jgi:hypothetical protein
MHHTRRPDGTTDVGALVIREAKNLRDKALEIVLGTVGKGVLAKEFEKSVDAIDARGGAATAKAVA